MQRYKDRFFDEFYYLNQNKGIVFNLLNNKFENAQQHWENYGIKNKFFPAEVSFPHRPIKVRICNDDPLFQLLTSQKNKHLQFVEEDADIDLFSKDIFLDGNARKVFYITGENECNSFFDQIQYVTVSKDIYSEADLVLPGVEHYSTSDRNKFRQKYYVQSDEVIVGCTVLNDIEKVVQVMNHLPKNYRLLVCDIDDFQRIYLDSYLSEPFYCCSKEIAYNLMDVSLYVGSKQPFAQNVYEAMSAGILCVTTDSGIFSQQLDLKLGKFLSNKDSKSIADSLHTVYSQNIVDVNSVKRVVKRITSLKDFANRFACYFNHILQKPAPTSFYIPNKGSGCKLCIQNLCLTNGGIESLLVDMAENFDPEKICFSHVLILRNQGFSEKIADELLKRGVEVLICQPVNHKGVRCFDSHKDAIDYLENKIDFMTCWGDLNFLNVIKDRDFLKCTWLHVVNQNVDNWLPDYSKNCDYNISVVKHALDRFPNDALNVDFIHNGCREHNIEGLREHQREQWGVGEEIVVGYAGRITPFKGLNRIIEAIANQKDMCFVLKGAGFDWVQDRYVLEQEPVNMICEKYSYDLSSFFAGIDVLISLSEFEAFANIFVEGLLHKVPVVCSKIAASLEHEETIGMPVYQYVLPEDGPDQIRQIIRNAVVQKDQVELAYSSVVDNFGTQKMIDKWTEFIQRCCSKKHIY